MAEGLLIGVALAIIFCAKPLNVFIKELADESPGVFIYMCLCLSFLAASWLLSWLGFTCVLVTYLLYQIGGNGIWQKLFQWVLRFRQSSSFSPMRAAKDKLV
jgi:hypothetical protein